VTAQSYVHRTAHHIRSLPPAAGRAAQPRWVDACPWRKSAVNHSGSHEEIRCFAILGANATGQAAKWKAFAEPCMAEYDLDG
jgi:hypothetical protein